MTDNLNVQRACACSFPAAKGSKLRSEGYTKHFYIEGRRINSKLGSGNGADTKNNKAGGSEVNYPGKQDQVQEGIVRNLKFLGQDCTAASFQDA